jgi:hypothetical protein
MASAELFAVRHRVVSFGAALHCVLHETSARALQLGMALLDTTTTTSAETQSTALRDALHAVRSHADAAELASLLLRAQGAVELPQRNNASALLAWLLASSPRRDSLLHALCAIACAVDSADLRLCALLAWVALRQRLADLLQRHAELTAAPPTTTPSLIVDLSLSAAHGVDAQALRVLQDDAAAVAAPILACARSVIDDCGDDVRVRRRADANDQLRATRLRVTAFDALLDAAALLSTVRVADADAVDAMVDAVLAVLPAVERWYEVPRPLLSFALERLERLLRGVRGIDERAFRLELALYHVSFFAPLALSENASAPPKRVVERVRQALGNVYHPFQPLSGPAPEEELQAEAEEQSFRACLGVCLQLGHLSDKRLRDVLQDLPAARLLDVAVGQFHGQSQSATARIAAQLATLAIGVVKKNDALALLEPLAELLKSSMPTSAAATRASVLERDNVADASALLLARVIGTIETPGALRGALLPLLQDGGDKVQATMRRHNAIVLLEHLLVVVGDQPAADSPLALELAHVLLDRLGDDHVQLRAAAARLFSRLDSAFIVPELVRRALSRDVRLRSAAEQAVLEHMQHIPPSQLPAALVLVLKETDASANATASDAAAAAGDVSARVLRTLPQWLGSLSAERGEAVVQQSIATALAMPRSAVGSRLLAGVLQALPQHAVGAAATLCKVLDEQGSVTAETLESVADDAAQLSGVLFGRVSPLLLLRALPTHALSSVDTDAELVARLNVALRARIEGEFEFDQVRKLAAELFGRLPAATVFDVALAALANSGAPTDVQKAYLFAALCAVAAADRHRQGDAVPTERVVHTLAAVFARPVLSEQVEQLQRGAIECLSCLLNLSLAPETDDGAADEPRLMQADEPAVVQSLRIVETTAPIVRAPTKKRAAAAAIVELSDSAAEQTLVQRLFERMMADAGGDAMQVRLCFGNALILLAGACGDARRARCFGLVVNGVLRGLASAGDKLSPLLLQLLFAWVYHGRALVPPFAVELVQTALQLARRTDVPLRFGGVKLLGALLSNDAVDSLFAGEHSPLADVASALDFVAADARSDGATKQLAEQLRAALQTPN